MMLGGHKVIAGGGIAILTDDGLFSPLRVLMDIEDDSAFSVERDPAKQAFLRQDFP